jgi:primosomal protein N'
MRKNHKRGGFVVCVKNKGYEASLELRKIYQAIADTGAARHHLLRVVDESGEDYLYPEDFFLPIELPKALEKEVLAVA